MKKKIILMLMILLSRYSFSVVVVHDIKSYIDQAQQWKKEAENFKQQMNILTNTRNIDEFMKDAMVAYENVKNLKDFITDPGQIFDRGKATLSKKIQKVYDKYKLFALCENEAKFHKKICEGKIINLAHVNIHNQRNLEFLQNQLQEIDDISQRMKNSQDIKESLDLSNAMQAKLALLQIKKLEMDVLDSNLRLANQLEKEKMRNASIESAKEELKLFIKEENEEYEENN